MNRQLCFSLFGLLVLLLITGCPNNTSEQRIAEQTIARTLIEADQSKSPLPSVKAELPDISFESAYRIQKLFVQHRLEGLAPGGYKAGFTTSASRESFGLKTPTTGVLPSQGRLTGSPTLKLSDYRLLWLETEIAFEMGVDLTDPLEEVLSAKEAIAYLRAAIELPDVTLKSMEPLIPEDLVAVNMLATSYLLGSKNSPDLDLSQLTISMTRNGELFHSYESPGSDELWEGAYWAINHILSQGYPIEKGMIILGGALGQPKKAEPGAYEADYGVFGKINFEVE